MITSDFSELRELAQWAIDMPGKAPAAAKRVWSDDETLDIRRVETSNERYIIDFLGLARFDVDFARERVGLPDDDIDPDTLHHLVANQIFPRILAHQGALVVHAAAISLELATLLFAGPSGAGKSTLASAFLTAGWALLGDDASLIEAEAEGLQCQALYQSLRLFEDSHQAVLDGGGIATAVAHYSRKRNVHGLGGTPIKEMRQVSAILFIDPVPASTIILEPMSPSESCIALFEHSFWLDPSDQSRNQVRLRLSAEATKRVDAFKLSYPRDYGAIAAVREAILRVCVPAGALP